MIVKETTQVAKGWQKLKLLAKSYVTRKVFERAFNRAQL